MTAVLLLFFGCAGAPPTRTAESTAATSTPPERSSAYEVNGKRYYPRASSSGFVQSGLASWYGDKFHGRLTANGERYNMYNDTAAHKTLPFDTYLRVTNLKNGKKTVVRINDRGPFVQGRIIDLSYGSANDLEMIDDGVVPVQIEALGYMQKKLHAGKWEREYIKHDSYELGDFTVQVGAFEQRENAVQLHASLSRKYNHTTVTIFDHGSRRLYRVRVGQYSRLYEAETAARRLQQQGFPNAFAVARDK
ncbi:MAG: septal ring lytic transglycosylase RlpA family protein [Deltaproteobacteria bacterium]|nr:MAG: septal ring lytic transglycosylase RlpA family protein [Deltaproteobacteria bacterium]